MKKWIHRDRFSLCVAAFLSALTIFGRAAEPGTPDAEAKIPIGLNGIPSETDVPQQAIAEEVQLNFFTTIFQWKEPEPDAYFWKCSAGDVH